MCFISKPYTGARGTSVGVLAAELLVPGGLVMTQFMRIDLEKHHHPSQNYHPLDKEMFSIIRFFLFVGKDKSVLFGIRPKPNGIKVQEQSGKP